jgi:hypothetical protein
MPEIEHSDYLDIRDLAVLAEECGDIISDEDSQEGYVEEAKETLAKLAEFAKERGHDCDPEDAESVKDALTDAGDNEPTLIADSYFTEYAEELCKDIGYISDDLPWFIANAIDWDQVADSLKADYSSVTLDGAEYWTRD